MRNSKDIKEISDLVKALFEKRFGRFDPEDFAAVAREFGLDVFRVAGSGQKEEIDYTCHAERQSGEGFWSVAPGAGDISEGMVWVSVIRDRPGRP